MSERYLALAPENRYQLASDFRMIEDEIRKWRRDIERVYYGNLHPTSVGTMSVPAYRSVDSFCRLAREILGIYPTDREYVGERQVPALDVYDGLGRLRGRRPI